MSNPPLPPGNTIRPPLVPARPGGPAIQPGGAPKPPSHSGGPLKMTIAPTLVKPKDDLSSIALEDDVSSPSGDAKSKIQAFGVRAMVQAQEYKRVATLTGTGAVHIKTFHGRLSDEGLQFMDDKINEWLEAHPQVEVKFATTQVGMYEGKIKDLALVVNIWY